ncbi:nicotinate (nicotinamide) nucleotide adenylyltransferase [Phocaeicola sp.]
METEGKIKTGIFGGSFNPIHIGHLALANYLCEYSELDEVWFLVSPHNPLKKQTDLWDDNLRLELVKLAIADYPKFRASDFEFHLPRPSYMVNTLDALQAAHPDREFTLIIGADNWKLFPRWYKSKEIMARHRIMVYPRPGYLMEQENLPPSVQLVDTPQLEISSTFIRRALSDGKDVRYFLHPAVYERINKTP